MFSQKARELPEFPEIVGSPVDDRGRGSAPHQVESFQPNFVTHEHTENDVGLKGLNMLDQAEIEIGEIAVRLRSKESNSST